MTARSIKDLEAIWLKLDKSKTLSDNLGGFGIGLNGMLSLLSSAAETVGFVFLVPLFESYTVIMAVYLLWMGVRARAGLGTLLSVVVVFIIDAALDFIPFLGGVADTFFRGPLVAAKIIQKDIETTHWVESTRAHAQAAGLHAGHVAEMHAQKKRRLVYLHD
jgi:hypothetical protein